MNVFLKFALLAVLAQSIAAATIGSSPVQKPSASAAGSSFLPSFSGDGRTLIFVSHANNLVTNDDLGPSLDVFARDLIVSNTVLVSVSTNGVGGANADVQDPVVSHDGRFVAFASRASNLVPGDTNNSSDVFVRDIGNGTTRLVSVAITGSSPKDPRPTANAPLSSSPMISADGRWVVFESRATNLVATPTPLNSVNVYARDTWSNVTVAVSVSQDGSLLNGGAALSSISTNGRFVAFNTTNNVVVPGVTNVGGDVYIRDVQTATTRWASSNVIQESVYKCYPAALSPNGAYIAFAVSNRVQIHIYDLTANSFTNVRSDTLYEREVQFSADSAHLLWDDNGRIVLLDLANGSSRTVSWRSCQAGGATGPSHCTFGEMTSADARYVTFLVSYDVYYVDSIFPFRVDLNSASSNIVYVSTNGAPVSWQRGWGTPVISPDGNYVAFDSTLASFVQNDLNASSDVFVRNFSNGTTEVISAPHQQRVAATPLAQSFLTPGSISADGSVIASLRYDDPSAGETNHLIDVFVKDLSNDMSSAVSITTNGAYTNLFGGLGSAGDTNLYRNPVISADGSTIAAVRGPGLQAGSLINPSIAVGRVSNRDYSQMRMVHIAPGESPSVSSDGLLMAFSSVEPSLDLYGGDNNFTSDIWLAYFHEVPFWYDYKRFFPVTVGYGAAGNGPSTSPCISPDDAHVAFTSRAGNLPGFNVGDSRAQYLKFQVLVNTIGTNRAATNYLLDRIGWNVLRSYSSIVTQAFAWIDVYDTNSHRTNVNFSFVPTEMGATNPVFSGDSRYLFYSLADNSAIYRHDLTDWHTNIWLYQYQPFPPYAVVRTNAVPGSENSLVCTNCRNLSVNSDGNVIVFERPRNGGGDVDVFSRIITNGTESLVSINRLGSSANGSSSSPLISGDGRYVVFQSFASDLIANDANGVSDIFMRDQMLGVTMLVSANAQNRPGNGPSSRPVLAANGRTVVFQSLANDLAANDYNDRRDIFVLTLSSADSDGDGMNDDWEVTYFGNLSLDGTADSDGDGARDLAEFEAGTDPTNLNSAFRVLIVSPSGGGSRQLIWNGNPARSYRAEYKDSVSAADWTSVDGVISWNGTTASIVDSTATNSPERFYRAVLLP